MSSSYETELARLRQTVQVRKTQAGWNIQMDNASWAEMMTAINSAIDSYERAGDQDRAARMRALRSALSYAESVER